MKKINCIIVHGGPINVVPSKPHDLANMYWMGWLAKKLNSMNIPTQNPSMPDPWNPKYEDYKSEFQKYDVNENTILIGHSRGCAFLVRWLGETKKKINKLILVAPYKIAVGDNEFKKKFYDFEIDGSIKNRVNKIIIFTSNNEEIEGKESVKLFHDKFGGKIINLRNKGHYTLDDVETKEFPELLDEIICG